MKLWSSLIQGKCNTQPCQPASLYKRISGLGQTAAVAYSDAATGQQNAITVKALHELSR